MLPALAPLQLDAIASPIGIVGALIAVVVAVVVIRFVLKMAVRVAIIGAIVVAVLWFLGVLGPLRGLLGV
jgi:hypothetical protein